MSNGTVISTGLLTDDTQVFEGRGVFRGVNVLSGTIAIYDGVDNTGTLLYQGDEISFSCNEGIRFTQGLFVDAVTGTGEAVIWWGA